MAQQKNSIEGQWTPLVDSATQGVPLSTDDLRQMSNNFAPTTKADHIPVRFGPAKGTGTVVAKISALKQAGSVLSGKLVDVDPRFDELMQAGKLGRRSSRSLSFTRDTSNGASLDAMGFHPPRIYHASGWHDGPCTDGALNDLLGAHREGDCIQFNANDVGTISVVMSEQPRRATKSGAGKRNSQQLHERTLEYAEKNKVNYCVALDRVAKQNPELTMPDQLQGTSKEPQTISGVLAAEGLRFQRNDEALAERAKQLAYEKRISFSEALDRVVEENPHLLLPDGVFSFGETAAPKRNDEKLCDLAKARAREKGITYTDALNDVVQAHPELTRR